MTLARLLSTDVLPLDHRETVARHRAVVVEYEKAAPDTFELDPVLDALDRLESNLGEFYDRVERDEIDADVANRTIKRLSRHLVPVNFATASRFEQDPTTHRPPYPSLAPVSRLVETSDDRYRSLQTHLRRARNAVVYELREARRAIPDMD